MKKVGRPRKTNFESKKNISVNLPIYLLEKIEQKLSYGSSRSRWIQKAIENNLEDSSSESPRYKDIETINLLKLIKDRPDIDSNIAFVIKMWLEKQYQKDAKRSLKLDNS